jgi:hypothetical protein
MAKHYVKAAGSPMTQFGDDTKPKAESCLFYGEGKLSELLEEKQFNCIKKHVILLRNKLISL